MKKKLIFGGGLISLTLVVSGLFIISELNEINSGERLMDRQDEILRVYETMIEDLMHSQAELFKRRAGRYINSKVLFEHLDRFERSLPPNVSNDSAYIRRMECNRCHSIGLKFESVQARLGYAQDHINNYNVLIRSIISISHKDAESGVLEDRAIEEGKAMLGHIRELEHAATKAKGKKEELIMPSLARARHAIVLTVALSILLSMAIGLIIIKAISGPINLLVEGIDEVSSGNYGKQVDIVSNDEIGFLAKTFNKMTKTLNESTMQKEALMAELKDLNSDLDHRVREATRELLVAHEMVLRNETLSAMGTFASGVAHELATPIASVMTYFQMVKERVPEGDKLADDVRIIEEELKRCTAILRGMLDFARAPEKEKAFTNINAVIHDLLSLVRYQPAYKRSIAIKEDLGPSMPMVLVVPGQFRQVLMNVIVNALQAMPDGGTLTVSTSLAEDGRRIVVGITDSGHGIPERELGRIFQPFYTGRDTGTGLGLSISYGIIKGHGGDMEVKSKEGQGTTFSIYLPLSPDLSSLTALSVEKDEDFKGTIG